MNKVIIALLLFISLIGCSTKDEAISDKLADNKLELLTTLAINDTLSQEQKKYFF